MTSRVTGGGSTKRPARFTNRRGQARKEDSRETNGIDAKHQPTLAVNSAPRAMLRLPTWKLTRSIADSFGASWHGGGDVLSSSVVNHFFDDPMFAAPHDDGAHSVAK